MDKFQYTHRDYESIKKALMERAKTLTPEWTDFSENDLGMVLLELFAGMADMLSYSIDRVANECFLPTAIERQSILNMAKLTGYTPRGARAARSKVCLQWNKVETDKHVKLPLFLSFTGGETSDSKSLTFQFDPCFWLLQADSAYQNLAQLLLPRIETQVQLLVPRIETQDAEKGKSEQFPELTFSTNSAIPLTENIPNVFELAMVTPHEEWYTISLEDSLKMMEKAEQKELPTAFLDIRLYQVQPGIQDQTSRVKPIRFFNFHEQPEQGVIALHPGELYFHPARPDILKFRIKSEGDTKTSLFLIQYFFGSLDASNQNSYYFLYHGKKEGEEKQGIEIYGDEPEIQSVEIQYFAREEKQKIGMGKFGENQSQEWQVQWSIVASGTKDVIEIEQPEKITRKANDQPWEIPLPKGFYASRLGVVKIEEGKEELLPVKSSISWIETDAGGVKTHRMQINKKETVTIENGREIQAHFYAKHSEQPLIQIEVKREFQIVEENTKNIQKITYVYPISNYEIEDYVEISASDLSKCTLRIERIHKEVEPYYIQNFPWPVGKKICSIPFSEFLFAPETDEYQYEVTQDGNIKALKNSFLTIRIRKKKGEILTLAPVTGFSRPTSEVLRSPKDTLLSLQLKMHEEEGKDKKSATSLQIYIPVIEGSCKGKECTLARTEQDQSATETLKIPPTLNRKVSEDGFLAIAESDAKKTFLVRQNSFLECLPGHPHYCVQWEEHEVSLLFSDRPPYSKASIFYRETCGKLGNLGKNTIGELKDTDRAKIYPKPDKIFNPVPGSGGEDEEDIEDMRKNIPKAVARRNRLVTREDYETFLKSNYPEIDHLEIVTAPHLPHEIALYLAPQSRYYLNPLLKQEIRQAIQKQKMVTTRVLLQDPQYVDISISFKAYLRDSALDKAAVKQTLQREIAANVNSLSFGSVIDAGEIYKTVMQHPEIRYIENPKIQRCYIVHGRLVEVAAFSAKSKGSKDLKGYRVQLLVRGPELIPTQEFQSGQTSEGNRSSSQSIPTQEFQSGQTSGCFCIVLRNCSFREMATSSTRKLCLGWKVVKDKNEATTDIQAHFLNLERLPFGLDQENTKSSLASLQDIQDKSTSGALRLQGTELARISDPDQIAIEID